MGGTGPPCQLACDVMTEGRMFTERAEVEGRETDRWIAVLYRYASQHPEPPCQYQLISIYLFSVHLSNRVPPQDNTVYRSSISLKSVADGFKIKLIG